MKKDKEWLKEQIKDEEVDLKYAFDNYVPYEKVLIADDVNELLNQLEEPQQDDQIEKLANFIMEHVPGEPSKSEGAVEVAIRLLSKQEKPVIPQFVATAIEKTKEERKNITMLNIFNEVLVSGFYTLRVDNWIIDNSDLFSRAWFGYTVEKEKLYRVRLPIAVWDEESSELQEHWYYLVYDNTSDETRLIQSLRAYEHYQAELSETLIKAIDERYWAFAEEE